MSATRQGPPARRRAHRLPLAAAAVAVFVLAALFAVPAMVDWGARKPEIAAAVEAASGYRLGIHGDIAVELLPSPRIVLEHVRLADPEDRSGPAFVTARRVAAELGWGVLWGGRARVSALTLEQPAILARCRPVSGCGWPFDLGGGAPESRFPLERIEIANGTITLIEPFFGLAGRAEDVEAVLKRDEAGRFAAEGKFALRGLEMGFDLALAAADAAGASRLDLRLETAERTLYGRLGGSLETAGQNRRLKGALEIKATGGTLLQALGLLAVPALEGLRREPFRLTAALAAEERSLALEEIGIKLGPITGEGRLALEAGAPAPTLSAEITVGQIDLDRLMGEEDADRPPAESPPAADSRRKSEAGAAGGGSAGEGSAGEGSAGEGSAGGESAVEVALPPTLGIAPEAPDPWARLETALNGMTAAIAVEARVLVWRGGIVRQARLEAGLADGLLALERLQALLPGGAQAEIAGTLKVADGQPVFEGEIRAASDSLRATLQWLGMALDAVPGERLHRFDLAAATRITRNDAEIRDIKTTLDSTNAAGAVNLGFETPFRIDADLVIDRFNADAYFPPSGAEEGGKRFAPVAGMRVPAFEGLVLDGEADIVHLIRDGAALRNIRVAARIENARLWAETKP